MYYFLGFNIIDEKKHYSLSGALYNQRNKDVQEFFDEDDYAGKPPTSLKLVLDQRSSIYKKRRATDKISFYANGIGFLFFASPKVKDCFEREEVPFLEYYRTKIVSDPEIEELEGHYIVKVLNKIDCIDFEKSELSLFDSGNIRRANNVVLHYDKIPTDLQAFLLGRINTPTILVHEKLKTLIENEGLSGFEFFPLDQAYKVF